jgi:hypothetical protein
LEITAAVWGLERLLDSGKPVVPACDDAELVAGAGNVQRALANISSLAATSLHSLLQEPLPGSATAGVLDDSALAERGVNIRAVYRGDRALTTDQSRCAHHLAAAGIKVRLAPVPVNMIIIDRNTVVLPTDPDRPADALVVLRGAMWARLADLIFEDTWQRAVPAGR